MEYPPGRPGAVDRLRILLFAATGAALPLFAFPVLRVAGRPVDPATVLAGLFVLACTPRLLRPGGDTRTGLLALAGAGLLPAFVLLPPAPSHFDLSSFTVSWAHWLLVVGFFAAAWTLPPFGERERDVLVLVNGAVGALVAMFAVYQIVGMPRGWPATGPTLFAFQREPLRLMQVGRTGYFRPTSVFLEPAWLGGYLVFVIALVSGAVAAGPAGRPRIGPLRAALAGGLVAVVLATVSWGSYVDLVATLLVLAAALVARGFDRRRLAVAAAIAVVVLGAALVSPPGRRVAAAVQERIELFFRTPVAADEGKAGLADSTWMRAKNASHTLEIFVRHPARGIGLGQFGRYALRDSPWMAWRATRDPWCGWLASAAELGLAGPAAVAVPIVLVLLRSRRASRVSRLPAVAALVALAVVEQLHTGSYIDLWWWYPLAAAAVLATGTPDGPATMSPRT